MRGDELLFIHHSLCGSVFNSLSSQLTYNHTCCTIHIHTNEQHKPKHNVAVFVKLKVVKCNPTQKSQNVRLKQIQHQPVVESIRINSHSYCIFVGLDGISANFRLYAMRSPS